MHKVSTANAVNEPGRVGRWGVGKPAAQFPLRLGSGWLRFAVRRSRLTLILNSA